jgi:hypothetical protein
MEEEMISPIVEDQDQGDVWRLQGIFFEPTKTFQAINVRPSFWLPLVLTVVIAILLSQALAYFVDLEDILLQQVKLNPQAAQLTEEQLEQQIKYTMPLFKWVGPVVAPPAMLFLFSGLILLMVHLSGSETTYKKLLGVTSHSLFLQGLVGAVLTILVYALASDPKAIDIQNPVYTNLSPLVDTRESPILYKIASSMDLVVWYVIYLLGLGTATVSRRMTVGKGVLLVAILYFIYVLLGVGWAAVWN